MSSDTQAQNGSRAATLSASRLGRRYILALSLIAILAIVSQVLLQFLIADQESDAHVVNIAGRQRMLGQKIAKTIPYVSSASNAASAEAASRYREELDEALSLLQRSHVGLLRGDGEMGLPGQNSKDVIALFGVVQPHHDAIVAAAAAMLSPSGGAGALDRNVRAIAEHEPSFLKGMNDIVSRYDAEAKAKVDFVKSFEVGLLGVTLLVLLLEAGFIFAPAARRIREDVMEISRHEKALEFHRDHLEELVLARTAELAQARDDAEAATRAKSIFLATMSHELRTPMAGVMGMIDLVLRRAVDPRQIDWLNKGKRSARHLLEIINDILDISQIEAERLTLDERNFSLSQVVDDAIQMQSEAARGKGLRLSGEIAPGLPDLLCGDARRLKQILINFISNAVKFSEHGQITVRVSGVEEDRLSISIRIDVTDQGIGISAEQKARLFHAFAQGDGAMNRRYGGTGLGLIISRRLALLMGGDAGVVSEEGRGSSFWATAKLKKGAAVVAEPPVDNVDAGPLLQQRHFSHRIPVVDDEPADLDVARRQMEAVDPVVDTAKDGAQAVAMAR